MAILPSGVSKTGEPRLPCAAHAEFEQKQIVLPILADQPLRPHEEGGVVVQAGIRIHFGHADDDVDVKLLG